MSVIAIKNACVSAMGSEMNRNTRSSRIFMHALWILVSTTLALYVSQAGAETESDRKLIITGYVAALLESKFSLRPDQYRIEVRDDALDVMIYDPGKNSLPAMGKALLPVEERFNVRSSVHLENRAGKIANRIVFPEGYLFKPLLAAPKEPRFSYSWVKSSSGGFDDILISVVGLGHDFGLVRWPLGDGDAWQLSIFVAAFSQFNMDSKSNDLLNTDYLVGFPLTFRYGSISGRFRLFHQSSHLGDELILGGYGPERVRHNVDIADFQIAKDIDDWRLYGGGGYVLKTADSEDLNWGLLDLGFDYASSHRVFLGQRIVAGLNINVLEERDWKTATSLKIGFAFGRPYPNPHGMSLMFEAYDGVSPFGQFYVNDIRYYGVGLYFDI